MIDPVSAFAIGGLSTMVLTGAVIQIVGLNPARKEIARLNDALTRAMTAKRVLREVYDRVVEENEVLGRDVMTLLAFKKKRNRSVGQRARDKAANRVLTVEKTAALRTYAQAHKSEPTALHA